MFVGGGIIIMTVQEVRGGSGRSQWGGSSGSIQLQQHLWRDGSTAAPMNINRRVREYQTLAGKAQVT